MSVILWAITNTQKRSYEYDRPLHIIKDGECLVRET
jgi:hypothetical protein